MKLSDICAELQESRLPATLEGEDRDVVGVNTVGDAVAGELTFLSNQKYQNAISTTKASAIIAQSKIEIPGRISTIRCEDPYAAVTVAIVLLHGHRKHPRWGIDGGAVIDPSAKIGANANIAGGATLAAGVTIGDNCVIYPGVYVAEGASLGNDCTLFPNVVVYDRCVLGNRVTVHAGSVIGEDGLGYAPQGEKWVKIPQVGRAVLGDDVEIGANCTIDRATLGQTEIGSGTKFGNVIVIGHGTKIGPDCLFVGLVGIAGSVTVGRHVTLAGQVGVAGHLTIGEGVSVAAQSGISGDIEPNTKLFGSPALPMEMARRAYSVLPKLPDWTKRIKELERQVEELKGRLDRADQAV